MEVLLANRYQLCRPLGQGGFGETFLAKDRYLPGQPDCVIKQLKPWVQTASALATAKRLFDAEAEALYRLGDHDQIPRLLAHFEQGGEFYLVQAYIAGPSLAAVLQERPRWSLAEVTVLLQDVLTVLAYVHQHNVIHRDIKPANLIRRQADGKWVLIDFGAVKALPAGSGPLTVAIGSAGYMAPEQQAGRPCFSSDLYSLGMVALQALTGRPPQALAESAGTPMIRCAALGLSLPVGLERVLDRLVSDDHRQRYPTAAAALATLQALNQSLHPGLSPLTVLPDSHPEPVTALPMAAVAPAPVAAQQAYRNRQALLNKVQHFWIEGVLERSLHHQHLLTLGLEDCSEAIAPPWRLSWEGDRPLPKGTELIAVFDHLDTGRTLLLLGEPGAGKTTLLLTLVRELLQRARVDPLQLIPVVFNLSSWRGAPIAVWLVGELNSKYQVPQAIGWQWVEQQQLLLLLDGLDELPAAQRPPCVTALNQFHRDYGPEMVVCSRRDDYAALTERLTFQTALYLQALTPAQVMQYLERLPNLTGLRTLLTREVPQLLPLAQSPLMLNIMIMAFEGAQTPQLQPAQDYRPQLFEAYIQRMLQRRQPTTYDPGQTLHWLQQLARRLQQTSQTVFLIERLQPSWLAPGLPRWSYRLGLLVSFVVISLAIGSQVLAWDRLLPAVAIGSVIGAYLFGCDRITPAESLRWSWRQVRQYLPLGLTLGPLIGWLLKGGFGLVFGDRSCLLSGACLWEYSLIGLTFGTMMGLTFSLIRGLSGTQVATVSRPNQGIWQSARNAVLFSLVSLVALLIPGLLLNNTKATFWAAAGLAFGFASGGGEAVIKHGILRLILFLQGVTPWNYARFLDYAAERIFLQKVGGGYIFIHRWLLEHFASRKTESPDHLSQCFRSISDASADGSADQESLG